MAARPGFRALAFAASLVFTLGVGEILCRIVGAPEVAPVRRGRLQVSENPRLLFEPVPALSHHGDLGDFEEYRGASNELGYRDHDHDIAKPAGTYRVVVLGDSIAAGYGIERTEDAFPARLERLLPAAMGRAVEVLNFGVTGYNTEQEVETLRSRALAFSPDLVLIAYCHNDRRPPDLRLVQALREAQGRKRTLPTTEAESLLIQSALYRVLRYASRGGSEARGAWNSPTEHGKGDTVEASLRDLAALAAQENFAVALAVFPYLPQLYEPIHAKEHEELATLASELGFAHLDLRPTFSDCRREKRRKLGLDRYHPSAAGHACASDALVAMITMMSTATKLGVPTTPAIPSLITP